MRQFSVSAAAAADFSEALDHYLETASDDVAIRFADAWDSVAVLLKEHPFAGSHRASSAFGIDGLRSIPLTSFPYVVFYTVTDDRLRIVGLLHSSRDLSKKLRP